MPANEQAVRRRRALLGPTLLALPALLVLLGFGGWQLQRMVWKQGLIATVEKHMTAPPVALPLRLDDPQAWQYRRVAVTGRFRHDREIHLIAHTQRGNLGYQIITPLDRSDGGAILVNRGWVPTEKRDPASRPEGQVAGEVTIEGLVRLSWGQGWFVPDNDPAKNVWFHGDFAAMVAAAGVDAPTAYMVDAGPAENPGGLPIGGQTRVQFRDDHLQYALTWFGLAAALIGVYVAFVRRRLADLP